MKQLVLLWALAALAVAACVLGVAAADSATTATTVFVDDDGMQCPNADKTTIQEAVDAAGAGAMVRVCPGLYDETVVVNKPLTIHGQIGAVDEIDCFAPTLGTLSADEHAIVDPPGATEVGFVLNADDVQLRGFIIEGGSIGITTSDEFSGYRIDHNLVRHQRQYQLAPGRLYGGYAIDLGTGGETQTRVDHNCFRDNAAFAPSAANGWGLATEFGDVIDARIDHNSSYGLITAIELARGRHRDVTIDHNESVRDLTGIGLWMSEGTSRIFANSSRLGRTRAIIVGGSNEGLEITHNVIEDGWRGIVFASWVPSAAPGPAVEGVLVRDNVIVGGGLDAILADSSAGLTGSIIADNTISRNAGNGIVLRPLTTGNTISGNSVLENGWNGIWAQTGTRNTFVENTMMGNGSGNPVAAPGLTRPPTPWVDARDDAWPANEWISNSCLTDWPAGRICQPVSA